MKKKNISIRPRAVPSPNTEAKRGQGDWSTRWNGCDNKLDIGISVILLIENNSMK